MSKTILITGGAGFIGSHFVRHVLAHSDLRIINLDALTYAGNPDTIADLKKNKRHVFVKGSITDQKLVERTFKKHKPMYVVNFAAESHVDRSLHGHGKLFLDTNIGGTLTLLDASRTYPVERFVQISTDEVYGSLQTTDMRRFKETDALSPRSPYSVSKAAAEMLCLAYHESWNTSVIITRSANNFGPYHYPEKFIPQAITKALHDQPIPLYGDGMQMRDWLYVEDNVAMIYEVLINGKVGQAYNIGAGQEMTNIDVASAILRILKKPESLLTFVADRPGHDRKYALDMAKTMTLLGEMPMAPFEERLASTIRWYQNNPKWIVSATKRLKKINPHIKL